jgi:small subunit ribosomal protein S1
MIELFVVSVKGSDIRLSPKPTGKNLADGLEDAFDMMLPVSGKVLEICKGGFRVQLQGSKVAFCPISQIDSTYVETPDEYLGKRFDFRITQFSEGGRNIVVSRRKLLDEEKDVSQGSFLAEHKAGDVVPGKIKRLEKFGAFVEVAPGVEGLAHISELAWSRVGDPSEVVAVGQMVDVKILKIEHVEGKTRIALSIKQTTQREAMADPWAEVARKFPVGTAAKGRVERKEHYGLFIKIAEGVTGLFPKSRAQEQPEFPYDKLRVGDEVMVQVAELRLEERRISLQAPKDPESDEWKTYVAPAAEGASGLGTLGGALGEQLRKAMEKKSGGRKS